MDAIRHKIVATSEALGLDPLLVEAVVLQESSGNPWAWNPEPHYRWLWDVASGRPFRALTPEENASEVPPPDFPAPRGAPRDSEWWGQQASWGLMQIMGAVAREAGFQGTFLTQLCEPDPNLAYGCRHLKGLLDRYGGDRRKALLAYNGGPAAALQNPAFNESYATEVMARWDELKKGR